MKFKYLFFLALFSLNVFADIETEGNNTPETSDPLTDNMPMTGQLSSLKDNDWFLFRTASSGKLELSFEHELIGVEGFWRYEYNQWQVSVFDKEDTLLSRTQINADDIKTDINIGVAKAGNYYINISPGNDSDKGIPQYDLHLTDPYTFTTSFSGTLPHKEELPDCRALFQDGILSVPCIDIPTGPGESVEYEAELELVPSSGPLLFEVTDAQPK